MLARMDSAASQACSKFDHFGMELIFITWQQTLLPYTTLPKKTKQQTTFLMDLQGGQVPTTTTFPMTAIGAGCFCRKEHYPLALHEV